MNNTKIAILRESLLFLHVEELRNICKKLAINDKGKKSTIIGRITHFLETGEVIIESTIPKISRAKKGVITVALLLHIKNLLICGF